MLSLILRKSRFFLGTKSHNSKYNLIMLKKLVGFKCIFYINYLLIILMKLTRSLVNSEFSGSIWFTTINPKQFFRMTENSHNTKIKSMASSTYVYYCHPFDHQKCLKTLILFISILLPQMCLKQWKQFSSFLHDILKKLTTPLSPSSFLIMFFL